MSKLSMRASAKERDMPRLDLSTASTSGECESEYDFEAEAALTPRSLDPRHKKLKKIESSPKASANDVLRARVRSRRFEMNFQEADDDDEEADDGDADDGDEDLGADDDLFA